MQENKSRAAGKPSQPSKADNSPRSMSKKTKFVPNSLTKGDHMKKSENKENKSPAKPCAKGRRGSGNRHFNYDLLEPTINVEDVPAPPSSTILSTTSVPDGGKIVSLRDPAGKIQVRIEYERDQVLKLSASPFSILPPACIKNVVTTMPELVAPFPVRHCYP